MTWLTWRQFRAQGAVAAVILTAVTAALAVTGAHVAHLYDIRGIATCHANCGARDNLFLVQVNSSVANHLPLIMGDLLLFVPAIIGIFWGAPLVTRELEAGTHRLAWNQSVTRTRWLVVKLGLVGAASMAATGLFSLMVTWSAGPIDAVNANRLSPLTFSERGIAPVGYAAFAFVLGVTAGVLIRRTVPAMALTLAVFAAVQILMSVSVRSHLVAPLHQTALISPTSATSIATMKGSSIGSLGVTGTVNLPGSWIYSDQTINAAGHVIVGTGIALPATGPLSMQTCGASQGPSKACFAELAKLGYRMLVTYQPASRFWTFQWYETAIYLVLALALAGLCFWWIRRRIS
jgi:ABC-type transport system involved in multi-copper enzyme maturation permease subunit